MHLAFVDCVRAEANKATVNDQGVLVLGRLEDHQYVIREKAVTVEPLSPTRTLPV